MFDPIHGGNHLSVAQLFAESLSGLRDSKHRVDVQIQELEAGKHAAPPIDLKALAGEFGARMDEAAIEAAAKLHSLIDLKTKAAKELRRFQMERSLARSATQPDWLKTALVLQLCILAEGLFTSVLMIGDGKMDTVSGTTYGLSVAAINVAAGVVTGFLGLRYANYRLEAEKPKTTDSIVRMVARSGLAVSAAAHVLLHFSAARVRATGAHSGLFDFTEIGLVETFNDYYAIGILVVGAISSIVAIYEGYCALSDAEPGYTRAIQEAEGGPLQAADDLCDAYLGVIETHLEAGSERIESADTTFDDAADAFASRHSKVREAISAHKRRVETTKDHLRAVIANERKSFERLHQEPFPDNQPSLDEFDLLIIPDLGGLPHEPNEAQTSCASIDEAIADLEARHDLAVASLEAAYAAFLAHVPSNSITS